MSMFWVFSTFLHEIYEANTETQKLCEQIAEKYLQRDREEFQAQNAREENIILKMDVENLDSLCCTIAENNSAQAKLNNLLEDAYKQQLKITFDFGECEMEKVFSFEEIKIIMESRESDNINQTLYWRKVKMAQKMEERIIVKEYRNFEREFFQTEEEYLRLQQSIQKLKEMDKEKQRDTHESILNLVKGSKDLKMMYTKQSHTNNSLTVSSVGHEKDHLSTFSQKFRSSQTPLRQAGLSSRLRLDFKQFYLPSVSVLPKIEMVNPTKNFNRLFDQAEVLRKHMQNSAIVLSDAAPPPKTILKSSAEVEKLSGSSQKTVSFEVDIAKDTPQTETDLGVTKAAEHELDRSLSGITKPKPIKQHIEILENIILKSADIPAQPKPSVKKEESVSTSDSKANMKRRNTNKEDDSSTNSPPKKQRTDAISEKQDAFMDVDSKSFLDMFLEFSKETPTVTSSVTESKKNHSPEAKQFRGNPIKEFPTEETNKVNEVENAATKDTNRSTKQKISSNKFEDFFSSFVDNENETNENNLSVNDMSFDFFETNENDDKNDAETDSFSFKF